MKTHLLGIILILLLLGCGSTRNWRAGLEKEWIGKTREELVAKRGKPYQVNSAAVKGTDIYIYHHFDFTPDIPPNEYFEEFFMNEKNMIYKIKTYRQ